MLQAAEQNLGLALGRELLAADALREGRLVRLSPLGAHDTSRRTPYWLVYPPSLRDWPPLAALRRWLHDEIELSRRRCVAAAARRASTSAVRRTGRNSACRSRQEVEAARASAARAASRAR